MTGLCCKWKTYIKSLVPISHRCSSSNPFLWKWVGCLAPEVSTPIIQLLAESVAMVLSMSLTVAAAHETLTEGLFVLDISLSHLVRAGYSILLNQWHCFHLKVKIRDCIAKKYEDTNLYNVGTAVICQNPSILPSMFGFNITKNNKNMMLRAISSFLAEYRC